MAKLEKTILLIAVVVLSMAGCSSQSIGVIGGADGPTTVFVTGGKNKEYKSEKEPVKAVMLDGEIYYETGEENEMIGRCGNLDGGFTKAVDKWELPKNDNEANFELKSKDYCGYQLGFTENTIEVPIDDDWKIFKKIITDEDIDRYKYVFKVEGDTKYQFGEKKYIILANDLNITANDVATFIQEGATSFPIEKSELPEMLVVAWDLD